MRIIITISVLAYLLAAPDRSAAQDDPPVEIHPYTMLPQPMGEDEFGALAVIVNLSEAQAAVADSLYHEYREGLSSLVPQIQELNQREAKRTLTGTVIRGEMVQRSPPLTIHERYEEAKAILSEARPIEATMSLLEQQFFGGLTAILAEPQQALLVDAQRARQRVAYQVRTTALPGAQVDLISLCRNLDPQWQERQAVADVLGAYEDRLVQLLQLRHEAQKRVHVGDLKWLASVDGVRIDQAALDARGRIRSRQIRLESRLRRLNMSTLEALSIVLDQDESTRLFDAFHAIAHPAWSPDSDTEQTRLALDTAANQEGLDEDVANELAYLHESFLANERRLQRRLSDVDFEFRERMHRTRSAHVDDMAAHDAEIQAILAERRALCEQMNQRLEVLEGAGVGD